MKRTLLQIVQKYLDRSSGFYVNSIFETDESQQAASLVEDVYARMVQDNRSLLFVQKDMALDALGDVTRPNFLKIPDDVIRIQESKIWYNAVKSTSTATLDYKEVQYIEPLEFITLTSAYTDSSDDATVVTGFDNNKMVVITNKAPSYCTSFDGVYLVFDSYDSAEDSTLQASKSRVLAQEEPVFLQQDDFVVPIPDHLSEVFLDMCLEEMYNFLRQEPNGILSQRARAGRIKLQQTSQKIGSGQRGKPRYGRSGSAYVDRRTYE